MRIITLKFEVPDCEIDTSDEVLKEAMTQYALESEVKLLSVSIKMTWLEKLLFWRK